MNLKNYSFTKNTHAFIIRFVILIYVVCSMQPVVWAQNNQLRAYTLEDGLPQSQVYDIIQDEVGYLWLGTQGGGLCRFNGEEFEIWTKNDGLQSNYIQGLDFVNDSLFIATKGGLSIKVKNRFTNLSGPAITKICKVRNQRYFATNTGIYTYHKNRGLVKVQLNAKINSSTINDIVYDGKLYWLATSTGLWKLNELNKDASIMQRHSAYDFTAAFFQNNKVFASAFNRGVLVITTNAKTYGNRWIQEPVRVTHIDSYKENELWFSTDNMGIVVIDAKEEKKKKVINRNSGLSVSNIRKSMQDRQSNIWIATSGGGFYKYFQNNFTHYDQNVGLKADRVYAVHHIKNNIWASNAELGLVCIHKDIGIRSIQQDKKLLDTKIKALTHDALGNLIAATDGKGILYKEIISLKDIETEKELERLKKDSRVSIDTILGVAFRNHIINKKKGLLSDWIGDVEVVDDYIWAASYSSGITKFKYDVKNKKIRQREKFTNKSGIKDLRIRDIEADIFLSLIHI